MRDFFRKITDFLIFSVVGLFYGFIGGLGIAMAVFAIRHRYFWCLGFTVFFVLFHLDDLQNFIREKDWLALTGRLVTLFAITSFIVSLFVFGIGAIYDIDIFDLASFAVFIPLAMIVNLFWTLLKTYGTETRLFAVIDKTLGGLYKVGVLWKY